MSQLTSQQRLDLSRQLATASGARKLDLLLAGDNPKALIRSLPAEDLFLTIKEIGLEDAGPLVELASPAQFRTFLDLDLWHREEPRPLGLLQWLRAADGEGYAKKVAAVDLELIELLFSQTVKLIVMEDDPDYVPQGTPWRSPEGKYELDFLAEGDDLVTLRALMDHYYALDPFQAVRLLEAVRWELPSELAEAALQFRTGRLADLGFPEFERAVQLYAFIDPDLPIEGAPTSPAEPPGVLLATLDGKVFLDEALRSLDAEKLSTIDRELLAVLNGALVADRVDLGDLESVRTALVRARDHLSLGLEYASGGELQRARELLMQAPLTRVFQVASGLTLRRKYRADRLMKLAGAAWPSTPQRCLLDPPLGSAIEALRTRRPRLDDTADGAAPGTGIRAFRSRADLARIDALLDEAEAQLLVIGRLGIDLVVAEQAARTARGELFGQVHLGELLLHLAMQGRGQPVAAIAPFELEGFLTAVEWALDEKDRPSAAFVAALEAPLKAAATRPVEQAAADRLLVQLLARAARELPPVKDPANEAELATAPVLVRLSS